MTIERSIAMTGVEMEAAMLRQHNGQVVTFTPNQVAGIDPISTLPDVYLDPATWGSSPLWVEVGGKAVGYSSDGVSFNKTSEYSGIHILPLTYDPTGNTDDSQIIRDAGTYAKDNNLLLVLPRGVRIGIGSTVTIDWAMSGSGGNSSERTVFKSLITDGTPVLATDNQSRHLIENFQILGSTNNLNPATNAQNCIGLQVGDPDYTGSVTDHACNNGYINNVDIYGCSGGFRSLGWSNNWGAISVRQAITGAYIDRFNGSNLNHLRLYNCNQYFKIRNSNGANFNSISCEGSYQSISSTIDGGVVDNSGGTELSNGINIGSLRYENAVDPTDNFLNIGFNSPEPINNILIGSGMIDAGVDSIPAIQLDNVIGYSINCFFKDKTGYSTTVNTRQRKYLQNIDRGFHFTAEKFIDTPALNVFPNSSLNSDAFPATAVVTSAVATEETNNIRSGNRALRLTGQDTKTSCRKEILITDSDIINSLKTGSMSFGAWVYLPDEPAMSPYIPDPIRPQIVVVAYNAGSAVHVLASAVKRQRVNGWSFLYVEKETADPVFDSIKVKFYVNNGGSAITANLEYMIVDSFHLCSGLVADKIFSGNVIDSSACSARSVGGRLEMKLVSTDVAATLADSTNNWKVGDSIKYKDPIAGGSIGKVCITAGAGTTAVWKDFGAIAA